MYVATGAEYIEEANESAGSFRQHNQEIPLAIATDQTDLVDKTLFSHIFPLTSPQGNFFDKIHGMLLSPFRKTAFIDTDAWAIGSVTDLFRILDHFELAVAFDPIRTDYKQEDIPDTFPTPNTGVIAYQNSPAVQAFLKEWLAAYELQMTLPVKPSHDQPAFRRALYFSKLRLTILPDEWNLRVIYPHLIGGNAQVKIIHGRHENRARAIKNAAVASFNPRAFSRDFSVVALLEMLLDRLIQAFHRLTGTKAPSRPRGGVKGKI